MPAMEEDMRRAICLTAVWTAACWVISWIGSELGAATIEVVATADTWIQKNQPNSNFSTNVNPSTQFRDATPNIVRAGLYQFTLPVLPANQNVTGASFRLISYSENGIKWHVDL